MAVEITSALLQQGGIDQALRKPRIGWQTYTLDLGPADVSATSAATGYPADAVLRPDTAERWKPTGADASITINLGATRTVSYVGIAAHTLGSTGTSVTVLGETISPADDEPILLLTTEQSVSSITLQLGGGPAHVGVVYVGEVLEVQRPVYGGHNPGPINRDTTMKKSLSRGGQFLGQHIRRKGYSTGVSLENLGPDWYRDNMDPFAVHARRYPFFFAWRPTRYPEEVMYAWTPSDLQPSNTGTRDLMAVDFDLRGFDE